MKSWKYNVKITEVIDGDSYRVENFDLGMGVYLKEVIIRLFGCNTWESRTKNKEEKAEGLKAKAKVKELIEGKEVQVETLEKPDKFGRTLGKVECEVGDLTTYLVKNGYAKEYFGEKKPDFKK